MKLQRLILSALVLGLVGCSTPSGSNFAQSSVSTAGMTKKNYKVVKSNLRGESYGFNLLMFLPIVTPNVANAKQMMYDQLDREGIKLEGRAIALANATEDRGGIYFLIGAVTKVTLTADIIEFLDDAPNGERPKMGAGSN